MDVFTYIARYPLASSAVFFVLLPLCLAWLRFAHAKGAFRLLFVFLLLDLAVGLWMMYLAAHRTNNILLLNLFVPFRYALFSGMFYYNFRSVAVRRVILYSIVAFGPMALLDIYASNHNLSDLHNHLVGRYSQVVESVLIILWVLLYFYEIIKTLAINNILGYPFFWVCAGLLIFYSGNIFYFPFWYYTNTWENKLQLGFIDDIPFIVEIISLSLFAIGIWLTRSHHDTLHA